MVDVKVRAPHAERHRNDDRLPRVAGKTGECELERYGAMVKPFSLEPYGGLGPESCKTLGALAMEGSVFYNNTWGSTGSRRYSIWRAELERILLFEVSDIVLLSLGHSIGVHSVRRSTSSARNATPK